MTNSTWNVSGNGGYFDPGNWSLEVPGINDTGFFGTSTDTSISIFGGGANIGAWNFVQGASQYSFAVGPIAVQFVGAGIVIDGGSVNIVNGGILHFFNNSTSGASSITNLPFGEILFDDVSTAGSANITNISILEFHSSSSAANAVITNYVSTQFFDFSSAGAASLVNGFKLFFNNTSTAGSATIHTLAGAATTFENFSNGGDAELITDFGGTVDFSQSAGPANNHKLTVGSIAGAGTYDLGADQLTVGSNGLATIARGLIADGGFGGGSGASLVKVGHGTLTLSHAGNTYSGGTTLGAGTLDVAAIGAAGAGAITFAAGPQRLTIENRALSHHVFGNVIDFFGKGDILDLSGLHIDAGATAT